MPFTFFFLIYYAHFVLNFYFYDVNASYHSICVMSMDVCDICDGVSGNIPTHVIMFNMVLFFIYATSSYIS